MLPLDAAIFVATEPIDLRWSFDLLCGVVRDRLNEEPRGGDLFLFFGRRLDRVKVLFWDKTGYCLLYKRLEQGRFRMPAGLDPNAASVEIDPQELSLLLEGLELPEPRSRRGLRRVH